MPRSISRAVMMCHAPIVVPAIGGQRAGQCEHTSRAMQRAAEALLADGPDLVVVLTPHGPRQDRAWGVFRGTAVHGDFHRFGHPELRYAFALDDASAVALEATCAERGVPTWSVRDVPLDHGALVPLHFVDGTGWRGPLLLLSVPWDATLAPALGTALAATATALGQCWAVLASADMSHRLIPGAPSGFHPRAREFDDALVAAIRSGDLRAAAAIPRDLRDLAAEDAIDTVTVAAAAVGWDSTGHEVFCYEGPFGVGYMEAVLHRGTP